MGDCIVYRIAMQMHQVLPFRPRGRGAAWPAAEMPLTPVGYVNNHGKEGREKNLRSPMGDRVSFGEFFSSLLIPFSSGHGSGTLGPQKRQVRDDW